MSLGNSDLRTIYPRVLKRHMYIYTCYFVYFHDAQPLMLAPSQAIKLGAFYRDQKQGSYLLTTMKSGYPRENLSKTLIL